MAKFVIMRQLNTLDRLLSEVDGALRALLVPEHRLGTRASPGDGVSDAPMSIEEHRHVVGLTRVNHAGEVCAQALYRGQALTAQLTTIKTQMTNAAIEERDHLAWCEQRLNELQGKPSCLNPLWYSGSFALGALAGLAGDKWSLGFVAETERQVQHHLQTHLACLPKQDKKTQAIFFTMEQEEAAHAETACAAGAADLPWVMKYGMRCVSQLLKRASYYI